MAGKKKKTSSKQNAPKSKKGYSGSAKNGGTNKGAAKKKAARKGGSAKTAEKNLNEYEKDIDSESKREIVEEGATDERINTDSESEQDEEAVEKRATDETTADNNVSEQDNDISPDDDISPTQDGDSNDPTQSTDQMIVEESTSVGTSANPTTDQEPPSKVQAAKAFVDNSCNELHIEVSPSMFIFLACVTVETTRNEPQTEKLCPLVPHVNHNYLKPSQVTSTINVLMGDPLQLHEQVMPDIGQDCRWLVYKRDKVGINNTLFFSSQVIFF